ncbi:MAG TPA: ATP-binding protein [Candidatus Dojkabacteria bacterium]|nr:ATP-binding protein [Candidatus Dojkabacteria bacterium]
MEILRRDIKNISFDEIVEFCKLGYPEGSQLDYKKKFSENFWSNELQKDVASFANMQGGIIIVGVKEDKTTGKPKEWEGIEINAEEIDRIDRIVANMTPLPHAESHLIPNEENTKCFLVIRILEGSNKPYYANNDPIEWIRTGKVKTPIEPASPQYKKYLFDDKNKASEQRKFLLEYANKIFKGHTFNRFEEMLLNGELDHSVIGSVHPDFDKTKARLQIAILPYNPNKTLITPSSLKDKIYNIRISEGITDFPIVNWAFQTTPKGISTFVHLDNDQTINMQIFGEGLIFFSYDICQEKETEKNIWQGFSLPVILKYTHLSLKLAESLYRNLGYQGELLSKIEIANVIGLNACSDLHSSQYKKALLYSYNWDILFNTYSISNEDEYWKTFAEFGKSVYESFDFSWVTPDKIKEYTMSSC